MNSPTLDGNQSQQVAAWLRHIHETCPTMLLDPQIEEKLNEIFECYKPEIEAFKAANVNRQPRFKIGDRVKYQIFYPIERVLFCEVTLVEKVDCNNVIAYFYNLKGMFGGYPASWDGIVEFYLQPAKKTNKGQDL